MANEKVLIVGAGALGIVTGYHLQLAGAQVDFLVRQGRLPALAEPQVLYCYDDHQLKHFDGYNAYASVMDAKSGGPYDFVVVTMDGATCRGEDKRAALEARFAEVVATIGDENVRRHYRDDVFGRLSDLFRPMQRERRGGAFVAVGGVSERERARRIEQGEVGALVAELHDGESGDAAIDARPICHSSRGEP